MSKCPSNKSTYSFLQTGDTWGSIHERRTTKNKKKGKEGTSEMLPCHECKTSCDNHSGDRAKEGKAETRSEGLEKFLDLIDSFRYTKPSPRAMARAFEGKREGIGTSGAHFKAPKTPEPVPLKRSAPAPAPEAKKSWKKAAKKSSNNEEGKQKADQVRKRGRRSTLKAAEKVWVGYRKVPPGFHFRPPRSSHRLIQEDHASDPWRVLVICMLLNVTTGRQVTQQSVCQYSCIIYLIIHT
jgi:hypothetical protein